MAPTATELVRRNEAYAATHQSLPTIAESQAHGGFALKTFTCVDPRVFPEQLLGLKTGEAAVFRTIAGHPQPVLNDIIALDRVFHGFNDLVLIHHTDCGATYFTDTWVRSELCKVHPSAESEIECMTFGAIPTSIEQNVRDDITWLKEHPLMRKELGQCINGYMYDLKSGRLQHVE